MATGNTLAAEGHILKLQSSPKLHKPGFESKLTWTKKQKSHKKNEYKTALFFARKLEENLGAFGVDFDNDWAFLVEVFSVQTERCIQSYGILPPNG